MEKERRRVRIEIEREREKRNNLERGNYSLFDYQSISTPMH